MAKRLKTGIYFTLVVFMAGAVFGSDWPMPGHDPQRTSCSPEQIGVCTSGRWCVQFDAYIPSRAPCITTEGGAGVAATVYVTAVDGIHALDPDTGAQRWCYEMEMPPGDAPTVSGATLYVCGTDKTIHAINAGTGDKLWQTDSAGAAFYVNPLVVNNRVYAGCRDGYFYCFDAANGNLVWYYKVGEKISFSAAYQTYAAFPQGIVFFAAENCCAYALTADSGTLLWKNGPLPADTFVAWWPVITDERVLFGSSTNYPTNDNDLRGLQREILVADASTLYDANSNYNLQHHIDWLIQYPQRNTFFVLDALSGMHTQVSPFLFWGNPGGQRYPAAIGPNGFIWLDTPWQDSWFGTGRYGGWDILTSVVKPVWGWESSDEPEAHAIIGNYIYHNDGGDGVDKGGVFSMTSGNEVGSWTNGTFRAAFGNYYGNWADRKYGNNFKDGQGSTWSYSLGHHGHQNPPVPLNGKVYFHRSNAVICMEP